MKKAIAGIVLFNPDVEFACNTVRDLLEQVPEVAIVDNSSRSNAHCFSSFGDRVIYKSNGGNLGIAAALNELMDIAKSLGADWLLTLDQDSSVCPNMVESLLQCANRDSKIAIACPQYIDRNCGRTVGEAGYTSGCITSGSLTNVKAWHAVGGFDEWMFIDLVDYEFCDRLVQNGWKIYCTDEIKMPHSVGDTEIKKVFGHSFTNENHSPFRKYYQMRNRVYLKWKRGEFSHVEIVVHSFVAAVKVLLWEKSKIEKIKAITKGTKDGLKKVSER